MLKMFECGHGGANGAVAVDLCLFHAQTIIAHFQLVTIFQFASLYTCFQRIMLRLRLPGTHVEWTGPPAGPEEANDSTVARRPRTKFSFCAIDDSGKKVH